MTSIVLFTLAALALEPPALYVNGVRADGLHNFEFKGVNVRIDETGNVWVDAPQYQISVASATPNATPPVAPVEQRTTTTTVAPGTSTAISSGRYWLVTEDHGSTGHVIEVTVNGTLVQKVQSGDAQLILDIGKFLRSGTNTVVFNALPANKLDGGVLNIYIGTGSNQSGTVMLDAPSVTFSRRSSDSPSGGSRSFQVEVP